MSHTFRIKHYIQLLATLDTDEKEIDFKRIDEVLNTVTRTDLEVGLSQSRIILKSASDEAISFGDISTGKFLYIESDLELTMKLNGGSEVFKLTPTSGSKAKLLWEGEFTGITLSNASSDTDANITYLIAG